MADRREAGFTLLELTAVLAIFSVLAILALNLLSQGMKNRDAISRLDARTADIAGAVAVLRRDLETMAPVADGDDVAFTVGTDLLSFASAAGADALLRVTWRVDAAGTLTRESAAWPAREAVTIPILSDVGGLTVETFDRDWSSAAIWRSDGPADLPRGIAVTLDLSEAGPLRVVVAR